MKRLIYSLLVSFAMICISNAQTYITENFEGDWSGSPEAPSGWTQSRYVQVGNGIPDGITATSGEKDWTKNTNTGTATWSIAPATPGTVPNAAYSGTGVAWIQARDFGSSGVIHGSRRLESPIVNLSSATSPYARFRLFYADGSSSMNLRLMASSDGGSTWKMLSQITANSDVTSFSSATPWTLINVKIPVAFKTANAKIGIELGSSWGTNNCFIDDFSVEEFTPTTITSAATGNWSSTSTWVGGVVPTSVHNVVIASGHTVSLNVNMARVQDCTVNGILQYSSTTSTMLFHVFGDLTIGSTGTYKSFSGTTGKRTYLGGNLSNSGIIDFGISGTSVSEATLIWLGYGDVTFTNTGTVNFNKLNAVWHCKEGSVTYNSPVAISTRCVLGYGTVVPKTELVIGKGSTSTTITVERIAGSFTTAPAFDPAVTRSVSYLGGNGALAAIANQVAPLNRTTMITGVEIENFGDPRTVAGTLLINTHGNVQLGYPLKVGNGTSGALTLTRGILITSPTNYLHLASNVTPPGGATPSTVTPPASHGSFVSGPLRVDMPTTTATRNFPLGVGTSFNDSLPTANVLKLVSLTSSTAWSAGTSLTVSITDKPSGILDGISAYGVTGVRGYYVDLNGGSDLPATATISLIANHYIHGNGAGSDSLYGNLENIRVAQATALTGPWTTRSTALGTGSILNNTSYAKTTLTSAPGPIAPLLTNGQFFAWGSSALNYNLTVNTPTIGYVRYFTNGIPMSGTVKNNGLLTTVNPGTITRTIVGTAYSDTQPIPAGIAPGVTDTINFADFTGWTSGTTYAIKDSIYMAGDGYAVDDTITVSTGTVKVPKTTLIIFTTSSAANDSLKSHLNLLGLSEHYDTLINGVPNISLSAWNTVFVITPSSGYFASTIRDSIKAFLDNANDPLHKKSLVVFANEQANRTDPLGVFSPGPADTVFLTQYLRAQFIADDWIDVFVSSDSTLKGRGGYPFNLITSQRITDPHPDLIRPAYWNQGSGMLTPAMIPANESGDGDTCVAVAYSGSYYNTYYQTNLYPSMYVSGSDGRGSVLNAVKEFITSQNGALPVELTSFSGSIKAGMVRLKWSTATEINSSKFILERSLVNGDWSRVAEINASGNSNSPREYSYNDKLQRAVKIQYRLRMVDNDGSVELSNVIEVSVGLPDAFALGQNYPNPFNPSTKVDYQLATDSKVTIELFSVIGERVALLVNADQAAGYYTVEMNRNTVGRELPSGVYIYRMTATGKDKQRYSGVKKMMLLK